MHAPDQAGDRSGLLLVLYGWLLGPLIAGYLLFDRAFAYLHPPGMPMYVGEIVLAIGALGSVAASRYLLGPIRDEPILALLVVFMLWGLIRFLPNINTYGIDSVHDSAVWYYGLFALFICAALAKSSNLLGRLIKQLSRLTPWLLLWLPLALILVSLITNGPYVPFTSVPVLSHKAGNVAIAALLALGSVWLFANGRSAASRGAWSLLALLVIAMAATQTRGGLLGAAAGTLVGLTFFRPRLQLIMQAVVIIALGLGIAGVLAPEIPIAGAGQRAFSASQLVNNVISLGDEEAPDYLRGTVEGRKELWSLIFDKQVTDGHLIDGFGFGPNLVAEVGMYDPDGQGDLRSPHNSHLNILARMGLVGFSLWIALWLSWYWRLVAGSRRLAQQGLCGRRRVAILCLMITTSILVSTFFDPQLEGAQIAALLWSTFGAGVAVTSVRTWFGDGASSTVSSGPVPRTS